MQSINQKRVNSISLGIIIFLSGCNTQQIQENATKVWDTGKENIEVLIGLGAAGSCALIANEKKAVYAAVCGVVGAFIGSQLKKHLNKQEQARMADATKQAIVSGETQQWVDPETGTKGRIKVIETTHEKDVSVTVPVLKGKVETTPPMTNVGATYKVKTASNVRGGPGTDYVVVSSLPKGEAIHAIGQVIGKNWYLVRRDGAAIGFVHGKLLLKAQDEIVVQKKTGTITEVENKEVIVERECRHLEQIIIKEDGSEYKEQIKSCKGASGWELA